MSSEKVDTLITSNQLPIIDLSQFDLKPGSEENLKAFAVKLRSAVYDRGLALLINHGVSHEKIQKCWNGFDKFLQLPEEVKEKYNRSTDCYTGYYPPGLEVFDEAKRSELRYSFNACEILREKIPPEFYDEICNILKDFKDLTQILLESMALALDMPKNFFTEKHREIMSEKFENLTTLRLLYYPPVPKGDEYTKNYIRCGAHKDYGTFTLLFQDSEGGLEIQMPGSEDWQRVGHLPGAIIINFGRIFDLWTSNRVPAVRHRVVIPKEINIKNNGRHSIAFFVHPDNEIMICPSDIPFPDSESKTSAKTLTALEHAQINVNKDVTIY